MTPTLLIFARYPRPGRVKSRLAARLGEDWAFRIYRAMLLDSADRFGSLPADQRRLFLSDCSEEEGRELISQTIPSQGFVLGIQRGADLGERLINGLHDCGHCAGGVLILGADSPTVPLSYLRDAAQEMETAPIVVGPALDGGYYLLGMKRVRTDLFEGIDWGSTRVLEQTLSRLRRDEYALLPRWSDVDTVHDLGRVRSEIADSPEWRESRLRAALSALDETSARIPTSNRQRPKSKGRFS
jgi:rSAM/selenodomain-associated transferase 1